MAYNYEYPYTDPNRYNDDWLINKIKEVEDIRVHGNIGVTTSQQMIESELSLRAKYDIYKIIAREFEREFLVQIY